MVLNIGDKAPEFDLKSTDGNNYNLDSFKDKKLFAVIFFCNHCPYANAAEERIKKIQEDFKKDLQIVCINSNDSDGYPEDSFDNMIKRAQEKNYNFVYLRDKTQEVAKEYGGQVTPDVFLFDNERKLRYRGRVDDNWEDESQATQHDFRNAVEALAKGEEVPVKEARAIGCSIKWK